MKSVLLFLSFTFLFYCNQHDNLESRYNQALKLYGINQRNDALKIFKEIYSIEPDYKFTTMMIGKILYYNQNFKEAIPYFESAIEQNPNNIDNVAWHIKATYAANYNHDDILKEIETCLQKDSNNLDALFIRGLIFQKKNNIEEAIKSYNAVLTISSLSSLAHKQLGEIYNKIHLTEKENFHKKAAKYIHDSLKSL